MQVGDIVTIKNDCGLLNIRIEERLSMYDVFRGIGDDKLPTIEWPRLEYHEGPYDTCLVTLSSRSEPPFDIYLLHINPGESPECFRGVCSETESDVFTTRY